MKILWCVMLGVSLLALGFTVFGMFSYSLFQFFVLGASLFISVLITQHPINIPGTQTKFSVRELMIFWGIIWLGAPGGILLSVCGMLRTLNTKNLSHKLFKVYCNIGATLAATNIFYLFLQYKAGFLHSTVGENGIETVQLITAVCLMAVTHYSVNAIIYSTFLNFQDDYSFSEILKEYKPPKAVAHCFTGEKDELHSYLDLGLYVGITGWICDERRGAHLKELVRDIPADRLLLETDSPYLTPRDMRPQPRARRNEPAHLPHILRSVAQALGKPPAQLAEETTRNAKAFFGLP